MFPQLPLCIGSCVLFSDSQEASARLVLGKEPENKPGDAMRQKPEAGGYRVWLGGGSFGGEEPTGAAYRASISVAATGVTQGDAEARHARRGSLLRRWRRCIAEDPRSSLAQDLEARRRSVIGVRLAGERETSSRILYACRTRLNRPRTLSLILHWPFSNIASLPGVMGRPLPAPQNPCLVSDRARCCALWRLLFLSRRLERAMNRLRHKTLSLFRS